MLTLFGSQSLVVELAEYWLSTVTAVEDPKLKGSLHQLRACARSTFAVLYPDPRRKEWDSI